MELGNLKLIPFTLSLKKMVRKVPIQAFVASASIVTALATLFVAIPKSKATATGCVWLGQSCIRVVGDSLHVDYIQGGVKLGRGQVVTGHMEVWGSGFDLNTSERNYGVICNPQTGQCDSIAWSERVTLNRNLPDGSRVCSRFWRKVGDHHEGGNGDIACETIEK